ncbi:MAG: RIP metalloprotease RseP [Deltaproteobacteria bacterium]|nr:RIP metalloprotease RseP [Deltaproteobacteria bacterium]MBW2199755.1 RIP metalloprotease RseP [Deltaproteobacteria bacterium]
MLTSIFAFVIVLSVLIFFHELGHFIVARLFGVGVEKFSLGFGPRLFGKKIGMTDYRISAIPLGGYVKMVGDEPDAEIDPAAIPFSFTHKHVFKRILIVAAGPLFNFLLAIVIFFGLFQISGTYILKASVGQVETGSPADKGGLEKGDLILSIDGYTVTSWEDMSEIISRSMGKTLSVSVRRGESIILIEIVPVIKTMQSIFGEDLDRYMIGISASGEAFTKDLNPFQALAESIVQTYKITELTVLSVIKLIQGVIPAKTLGGPILIAQMAGQQAKAGTANLLFFIAVISINLAILNFLPIPVLDGGHLLFFFIEAIKGSPVNTKMREIAQQAGIFVLIFLMILVFYNDITR